MKKVFYFIPLLVVLLWSLGSCSKEKEINRDLPSNLGNTVVFTIDGGTPTTRATSSGGSINTTALPREKAIKSIYALTFKEGKFYKTFRAVLEGTKYKFDLLQGGAFDIYLVANPDETLAKKLEKDITTPTELAALIATQEPGADNTATNFLMTAEKFTVNATPGEESDAGAILLTRLVARFDLYNRVEGLKITKVTFKKRPVHSRIATGTDMTGLSITTDKTYATNQGLEANQCIAAIYSYENVEVGNTVLTFEGTFDGKEINPYDITLEGLAVKRNSLYSIIISNEGGGVTPGDPGKFKLNVVVNDWNEGTTIEWSGDNLINTNPPKITVSSTMDLTLTPSENPTEITTSTYTATDIKVLVTADASSASKLVPLQPLPTGYTITPGIVSNANGKLTQEFTIHLPVNWDKGKDLEFNAVNVFDSYARHSFTIKHTGQKDLRPKLAIEYVAEYNIGITPGVFTDSHANDKSGYYNWEAAKAMTMPTGYHLPTKDECISIIPENQNYVNYHSTGKYNQISETISINGESKAYVADYNNAGNGITYALRFKEQGNKHLSAYLYYYVNNPASSGEKMLKIIVRYLGDSFTGDINTVSNWAYWNYGNGRPGDIIRIFPAAGHIEQPSGNLIGRGGFGYYWNSTEFDSDSGYCIYFNNTYSNTQFATNKFRQLVVRPFSDN